MTERQMRREDRAYLDGYEQACREWIASVSESGRITEENLARRAAALAQVRTGRQRRKTR